jgi:hypothetical protein
MVALTLGLMIAAAARNLDASPRATDECAVAEYQTNGRYAADFLRRDPARGLPE